MPRKALNPEGSAMPARGTEFIYALVCPITDTIRYVGRTANSLNMRFSTHMGQLTAKKQSNTALLTWKQALGVAGLRPIIKLLEVAPVGDANCAERRWTRTFQKLGNGMLNVRNVLLSDCAIGFDYDLWELNDIADFHGLEIDSVATGANACPASVIGFMSGSKKVSRQTAENVVKFLRSLPAERLPIKHGGIFDYTDYFLDDYLKTLYSK